MLTDQHLPRGTHASILDRNNIIVARTLRDSETVGKPAQPDVAATMATDEGIAPFTSWEGTRLISAYSRAPRSGFWVRISIPEAEFLAPLYAALLRVALFGAILLGAALGMALLLASLFAASLRFLTPGGAAHGFAAEAGGSSGLMEVDKLGKALARASLERDDALAEMRLLWATSPIGMAHADVGGAVQIANESFLRMVGLTRADLEAGRARWDDLTPAEWRPRDRSAIAEALANGSCQPYEKEFIRPDGQLVPVLVVFGLLERSRQRCVGFVIDLTERKRNEAALAQSEARLVQAQEAGGVGLWDLDLDAAIAHVTPICLALHGLPIAPDGTIRFDVWLDMVAPEDRSRVAAETGAAVETAGTLNTEFRIRRADTGAMRWLHARARYLPADGSRRLVGTVQDITQRKEAEIAAHESECLVRSILASTTDCVKVMDTEGRILFVNEAGAHKFSATDPASVIGQPWSDFWDREDVPSVRAAVAQAAAGHDARFLAQTRTIAGSTIWWDVAISPIPGPDGPPIRIVAISRDVTVSRLADEEVRQLNAALQPLLTERTRALLETEKELLAEVQRREEVQTTLLQAQKLEALGQLTSGVAHDFNNMLAAIQGTFELLAKRVHDESGVRLLQSGRKATSRAAALIRQLLAFARREEPRTVVLNPRLMLQEASELVRHAVGPAVRLVLDPVPEHIWNIVADLHQMEVALLNLAVNARDAMQAGGTLTFSARNLPAGEGDRSPGMPTGDCVLLAVRDTGIGMSPEVLARASDPFYTTKDKGKGTGLGLAMVSGMARQLGGALHISSAVGEGTTMTIALPRADAIASGPETAELLIDLALHGGATLLVVDDDDPVRAVTAGFLRDLGYTVIEAISAEAALALARASGSVDLVVTDVVMSGAGGPVLASRLRREWPGLPILFVTGYATGSDLSGEAVIAKPFNFAELASLVAEQLGRVDRDGIGA
jgi:PAS domain S-box-containing protein